MILGSLRFLIVSHGDTKKLRFPTIFQCLFSSVGVTVGAEMLSGGSVVSGWDQLERAGPTDDRQVYSW